MTRDGNVELEVGGEKIGLRFDTWVWKNVTIKTNSKGMIDTLSKYGFGKTKEELLELGFDLDINLYIILICEALNEYNYSKKIDKVYTEREASEVIDKIGGTLEAMALVGKTLNQVESKNVEPPAMGENSE